MACWDEGEIPEPNRKFGWKKEKGEEEEEEEQMVLVGA
jgi:hypothetical protein